jgi:hypothetical protein
MLAPPKQLYPRNPGSLWALLDLRDPEACQRLHGTTPSGEDLPGGLRARSHDPDFVLRRDAEGDVVSIFETVSVWPGGERGFVPPPRLKDHSE